MNTKIPPVQPPPAGDLSLWLSECPTLVTVRGHSMEPFLQGGDRVQVVLTTPGELSSGDLVVFERAGEVVVHRFLGWSRGGMLEMGDGQSRANRHEIPDVVGKAVSLERTSGERIDLEEPASAPARRQAARRLRRRHRIHAAAGRIPFDLPRRAFLKLLRRLL
ncbi:MAG: S24/S26 family peptidase [Acidobacteriota bacterium]|jgi:hypothetical protein